MCIYTNVDSFINKIDEFKLRFMNNEVNPDIIMVTEVLPKNSRYIVNKSELALEGYDIFHQIMVEV